MSGLPILTTISALWCVVVWAMINTRSDPSWSFVAKWGYLSDDAILSGAYWGLVTGAFVHIDFLHLAFNLYWLYFLGGAIERSIGPFKWIALVLSTAAVSSGIELLGGSAGIGFSGVGYALFGFAWITRGRYPEIARIATEKLLHLFIGWGLLCIVLTYIKVFNVGNLAHASGLAFGLLVGSWTIAPQRRILISIGIAALAAGAVTSLFWNPMSQDWVADQAIREVTRKNYPEAIRHYRRYLDIGEDPAWAWEGLAEIYAFQEDGTRYREAIEELESIDSEAAKRVIENYGEPK